MNKITKISLIVGGVVLSLGLILLITGMFIPTKDMYQTSWGFDMHYEQLTVSWFLNKNYEISQALGIKSSANLFDLPGLFDDLLTSPITGYESYSEAWKELMMFANIAIWGFAFIMISLPILIAGIVLKFTIKDKETSKKEVKE